jgi:Protein of unknown function (DUF2490)
MFPRHQFVLVLLILLFATGRAAAQTLPARDLQQWSQIAVAYQASVQLGVTAFGELRAANDVSQFEEEFLSAEVIYSPWQWMSLGIGYRYIHANQNLTGLDHENRGYADATFNARPFHGFLLSDRVRPELRWLQRPKGATFTQRYRDRVTLERPIKVRAKTYTPFGMWEKFYDASVGAWTETRYYTGVTVPVAERMSLQLYFLHQTDWSSRPFDANVLGVSLLFHSPGARVSHPH